MPNIAAFARVNASGAVFNSYGVADVVRFGQGRYNVILDPPISNPGCLIGTINADPPSDPGPGSSSITVSYINPTTLFVRTATPSSPNPQAVDDDRPFSILIINP